MTATPAPTVSQIIPTRLGAIEGVRFGHGPAVLLLHGAMGGWDQSVLLARAASNAPDFEWIAISRPGYLRTPLSLGRTAAEQADLGAAVLDSLGIRQAAVMGISAGGPPALQFALRHAGRCRALVMFAACSATLTTPVPLRFRLMAWLARFPGVIERLRAKAVENSEKASIRFIPDAALRVRTLQDPEVGPLYREFLSMTFEHMAERLAGTKNDIAQTRTPFFLPVEKIQAPTFIVHGSADEAVPFAQAQSLASRISGAEFLAIPDARHVCLFTHRDLIRPRLDHFLRSTAATR